MRCATGAAGPFRIETVAGIDDYQMMREVIRRRYSGSLSKELFLPDLIVIDGGKGQLSAACEELAVLRLSLPAMGLAKRFEHIFLPATPEPVVLLSTSPVLHLLQHIRDEAHRFAVTYHRTLRKRTVSASTLHEIPGIGRRRAQRLLAEFGSVARLANISADDIARVAGISRDLALRVLERVGRPSRRRFTPYHGSPARQCGEEVA